MVHLHIGLGWNFISWEFHDIIKLYKFCKHAQIQFIRIFVFSQCVRCLNSENQVITTCTKSVLKATQVIATTLAVLRQFRKLWRDWLHLHLHLLEFTALLLLQVAICLWLSRSEFNGYIFRHSRFVDEVSSLSVVTLIIKLDALLVCSTF